MNAKPKYTFSLSFGNVLTVISGIIFAFTVIVALRVSIASAEQERIAMKYRIVKNETAIEQVIALREDIIRITVNQQHQSKQIDSVLDYLKKTNERVIR